MLIIPYHIQEIMLSCVNIRYIHSIKYTYYRIQIPSITSITQRIPVTFNIKQKAISIKQIHRKSDSAKGIVQLSKKYSNFTVIIVGKEVPMCTLQENSTSFAAPITYTKTSSQRRRLKLKEVLINTKSFLTQRKVLLD